MGYIDNTLYAYTRKDIYLYDTGQNSNSINP